MFYAYGVSTQGAYHIKNDVVCQDSHKIVKCGDNMIIAAVADGLGSEQYTDVASRLAADIATAYCAENIKKDDESRDILDTIRASFMISQRCIEKTAEDNGHDIDQYDTTLSLAVVIDDALYYGHSGDSGILVMAADGAFYKVTEQQHDDMGRVYPLAFEEHWIFQKYERKVVSVLLATDGMLESFFPIYIRKEKVNIHVPLARFFMDRDLLHIAEDGEDAVSSRMEKFLKEINPVQVSDDKTIVALINVSAECEKQPDDYYKEPDWEKLKKKFNDEWRRAAYPDLYKDEDEAEKESSKSDAKEVVRDEEAETHGSDGSNDNTPREGEGHADENICREQAGKSERRHFTEDEVQYIRQKLSGRKLQNIHGGFKELSAKDHPSGNIKPEPD